MSSSPSSWILENQSRSGGFGIVSIWFHKDSQSRMAVKQCRMEQSLSKSLREQWVNEVEILGQLNHPNVIKSFPPPSDFPSESHEVGHQASPLSGALSPLPLLFMEYCSGGDLRGTLNLCYNSSGMEQRLVLAIISDLTSALGYLHNRRIIHRDLKPENVVLHRDKDRVVYKLIDLGYAKKLDQSSLAQTIVGTLQYLAPEFYMGNKYTKSVDYWSLGLITHEIVTGFRPFLPDYPPGKWMEVVENKRRETICVPEKDDERSELFEENHISESLQKDLCSWLQSLLEWDAHLRGKNEVSDDITVFSELNMILNRTRLRVVLLDRSYNKLDYVLEAGVSSSLEALGARIEERAHIPKVYQILLSGNGNRVLSLEPFMKEKEADGGGVSGGLVIYVLDSRIVADIEKKISYYGIQIPSAVKTALKSPKEKVEFKTKKKIYAHGYYLLRQEMENHENLVTGSRVLIVHLLNEVKMMNNSSQGLMKLFEKAITKFDLHQESLQYDIEKYKDQAQRKQRITSAKIFDSWRNPDPHLEKQLKAINVDVSSFDTEVKRINSDIRSLQKSSSLQVESSSDMKEFCAKSLSLCETLRAFSSSSGRPSESSNVVEMARLIVICLKRRDELLRKHFTLLNQILTHVNAINALMPKIEMAKNKLEIFLVSVSRSQRKRQSDVWKLLSAALQLSPSPTTPTGASPFSQGAELFSGVDESSQLIGENQILRSNLQRALDSASETLDRFNQIM